MYQGLIAALLISSVLTIVSVLLLRHKGPWGSSWSFFLVMFLTLWAVAIYIAPAGPIFNGVAWMPILIAGILIALLLVAAMPDANHWRDEAIATTNKISLEDPERKMSVSKLFWVLITLLAIAILIGMVNPQKAL